MKFKLFLFFSFVLSLILSINNINTFVLKESLILPFSFSILGVGLTIYTFAFVPIQLLSKPFNQNEVKKLMVELKEDIRYMFFLSLFFFVINVFYQIDFINLNDVYNLNFGAFNIFSVKKFIYDMCSYYAFCVILYLLYDLLNSIFTIIEISVFNNTKK